MTSHSMRPYAGRNVLVHLPPGYDETRREPYPVLLLHDGQNLTASRSEALGGSWQADETIDRLVTDGLIPPLVLVGIDHTGEERVREFTPTAGRQAGAGRARDYTAWLASRLLPALSADLHIRTDFDGLALGGSSLGGLVTLSVASTHPDLFGRLIVMSPSVWWDGRVILRQLREAPLNPSARVWIDAGRKEGRIVMRDARALRDLLRRQQHEAVQYIEDPEGDHSEQSWGRRLSEALTWLYLA